MIDLLFKVLANTELAWGTDCSEMRNILPWIGVCQGRPSPYLFHFIYKKLTEMSSLLMMIVTDRRKGLIFKIIHLLIQLGYALDDWADRKCDLL